MHRKPSSGMQMATAPYTPDKCEVWVPTQKGEAAFAATVAASGLPADTCDVHKINLGGGFGRRGAFHDGVTQSADRQGEARHTGQAPLDAGGDVTHGRYHPVMQAKLVSGNAKVESIIMPSGGNEPWGGVGEPTLCVAAPALLNAYFKATGKRQAHPVVPTKEPQDRHDGIMA